jgi:hypothetical protein
MIKVTDEIRVEARRLLAHDVAQYNRPILQSIADGKRKRIDADWWKKFYADFDQTKLAKIAAMTDPATNSNEPQRKVAETKLAEFKPRLAPGMPPPPPPLPTDAAGWTRKRKAKTKTRTAPQLAQLADNFADASTSDSVSVLDVLNKRRAEKRAVMRAGLKCESCGKPLAARRATARYCNSTCRSQAWRTTRAQ